VAQWQWITQERNGDQIADVTGLNNRKIMVQLKQPGMASAQLRVNDPQARRDDLGGLAEGIHELTVYRDGVPLETVFQLTDAAPSGTADTTNLGFTWQGIASYLQDAKVLGQSAVFSGTQLPWVWINAFQGRTGGDYGITQGGVTGTPPSRQKLVQQDMGLFDAITELSNSGDGFDWAVDASRAYREWHSDRGSDNGIVLEPGVNVTKWNFTSSTKPGEIVTDLTVRGGTQSVTASDATARSLYGRREATVTLFSDTETSSDTAGQVQAHADSAIARYVAPRIVPQITLVRNHQSIEWGSYWLGDLVTFRVRIGKWDWINQLYRIVQIEIALDDNDNETITLGVNAL
jgi:hypothetical protein